MLSLPVSALKITRKACIPIGKLIKYGFDSTSNRSIAMRGYFVGRLAAAALLTGLVGCGRKADPPRETAPPVPAEAPASTETPRSEPAPAPPPAPAPSAAANVELPPMTPEAFREAAFNGDEEAVARALQAGIDPNATDDEGRTALMLAAFNGCTAICRRLIGAGAQVDAMDKVNRTPLMFASTGPAADTVRVLLDAGAKINLSDTHEHWTPLMFAAAEGHANVIRLLLDRGADPTPKDDDGDTAENHAVNAGHAAAAEMIRSAMK